MSITSHPDVLTYYTEQSRFTTPGKYAYLFDELPDDIPGLCRVVQGLILHYMASESHGYRIPKTRLPEVDTRYVDKMLAKIIEHDDSPLSTPRPPEKRMIGCCRDFGTLFCAMARYKGIPTRTRIGFAAYIKIKGIPDSFHVDHAIAEYWDIDAERWRLVDPEQTDNLVRHNKIAFDVTDIPRDQFVVGGLAWQMIQQGTSPLQFGDDPGHMFKGKWAIRNRLILDLAALNKRETLLWDTWGLMDMRARITDADRDLLDQVAAATVGDKLPFEQIQHLFTAPGLETPASVMCYSPTNRFRSVKLQFVVKEKRKA